MFTSPSPSGRGRGCWKPKEDRSPAPVVALEGEEEEAGKPGEPAKDGELKVILKYVSLCIEFSVSLSTNFNGVDMN